MLTDMENVIPLSLAFFIIQCCGLFDSGLVTGHLIS
jgi:hypothetical protein